MEHNRTSIDDRVVWRANARPVSAWAFTRSYDTNSYGGLYIIVATRTSTPCYGNGAPCNKQL